MPGSTFQTNPIDLTDLLHDCHSGGLQLPDFQRSWVWDEDRIKSLVASGLSSWSPHDARHGRAGQLQAKTR